MIELSGNEFERRIAELELVLDERQVQLEQLQKQHAYIQRRVGEHEATLKRIYDSEGWKLLAVLYRIREIVLPPRLRALLRRGWTFFRSTEGAPPGNVREQLYQQWIAAREPKHRELIRQRKQRFPVAPTISVIVRTFNTPAKFLKAMIDSVRKQTYANWQLCVVDDGSTAEHVWPLLQKYARRDQRIRVHRLVQTEGTAAALNEDIGISQGDWIGFLEPGDVLAPFALHATVAAINAYADADLIYSDEDRLDECGRRCEPQFKPDWSPETMWAKNYVGHFLALRRDFLVSLGALRGEFADAYAYDLVLRAGERARRIVHIPQMLYHGRKEVRLPAGEGAKGGADAGRRALAEHFQRRGIQAVPFDCEIPHPNGVEFQPAHRPLVSIIIPNRDQPQLLGKCMRALARSNYRPIEILIIENGSQDLRTHQLYAAWQAAGLCRVLTWSEPFHFATMNNFAASEARGELLLLMNNDVEALNADWLEFMAGYGQLPAIGAVGAKLLFPSGNLQHGGVVLGLNGSAGHIGSGCSPDDPELLGNMAFVRNCACVTGACLLVRKTVFDEVGGFDEQFPFDFNDIDFCLRLLEHGYRNIWTPDACLLHHESQTRGTVMCPERHERAQRDTIAFWAKWGPRIRAGDPYFSPHFRLDRPTYVLKVPDKK